MTAKDDRPEGLLDEARRPNQAIGIAAARSVRHAIGYAHPTEMEIEVLAYMRGAIVRRAPVKGARANLLRLGSRGIIGLANGLSQPERRWAIAHELGHFEAHPDISFAGLCSSEDMLPSYRNSGHEPEANAFAAELLMPEDLFAPRCDVQRVRWEHVTSLAREFEVSTMAAACRFIAFAELRAAVVCMKDGVILWTRATKGFGARPNRNSRVQSCTAAYAYFTNGSLSHAPQSVIASGWLEHACDDADLIEDVHPIPEHGMAMSLLSWKS